MAKVILAMYSGPFYEGEWKIGYYHEAMINELVNFGNEVLVINSADFLKAPWMGQNELLDGINADSLQKKITDFDPDLIIAFNNSTLKDLYKWVDCPYVVWDSDPWPHFFCDMDTIHKHPERFTFFAHSEYGVRAYERDFSAYKSNIHWVRGASSIRPNFAQPKTSNIGLIASSCVLNTNLKKYINENQHFFSKILNESSDIDYIYSQIPKVDINRYKLTNSMMISLFTSTDRKHLVSTLQPLGFKLLGDYGWIKESDGNLNLLKAYDDRLIYSLKQLQHFYNSVKIGISLSHDQAISGYPWRIFDIMSSSACLVSNAKPDLLKDFHDVPLMTYETPVEAYKICQTLLDEPSRREDIVAQSNEKMESENTWSIRYKQIEQICNVDLTSNSKIGSYELLDIVDFQNISSITSQGLLVRLLGSMSKSTVSQLLTLNKRIKLSKLLPQSSKHALYYLISDKLIENNNKKSRALYDVDN